MEKTQMVDFLENILCNTFPHIKKGQSGLSLLPLTGKEIGLTTIELYQFLMCVEKEFDVLFSDVDFANSSFFTLQDFCDSIIIKLNMK